jgi:hypothetical protein
MVREGEVRSLCVDLRGVVRGCVRGVGGWT